jgi:hypothetical protein
MNRTKSLLRLGAMSRFLRIDSHQDDPYDLFVRSLRRSRQAIERTYHEAFQASDRCNALLKEVQWVWAQTKDAFEWATFIPTFGGEIPAARIDNLYKDAQVEDHYCDLQSSIVALFADDQLQTLAEQVLGRRIGLEGYGPVYGNGVKLTAMLRATTNAIRHLSEWSDLKFPYENPATLAARDSSRRQLDNIYVLQRAFGIGINEPIRDVVSWRTIVVIDGLYGTSPPEYVRFENAVMEAAMDIARNGPSDALTRLDAASKTGGQKDGVRAAADGV